MSLTVLIAPSGFKESLSVKDVAEAIARGVRRAAPHATILTAPMVDGGEGTTEALVAATAGRMLAAEVTGPVGEPVAGFWGLMGGEGPPIAVIEMAAAGMARALGARLLDAHGRDLPEGGGALQQLDRIDLAGLDPRLAGVRIDAAVNWHNMLLGPRGVARVFGPQKGATPEQVEELDRGMTRYATAILAATGRDVAQVAGAGASGGLGAGLVAFAGATLHPRFQIMLDYLDFDRLLGRADLVITAEGALDAQSPFGKVPCEVARRAEALGIPTVALAGTIGKGARQTYEHGIGAYASIMRRPCSLQKAIGGGAKLLRDAAENTMRMLLVGQRLAARA